jgi:hypothetical protein
MSRSSVIGGLTLLVAVSTLAADRYVSPNGKHQSPFTSWAAASTNLKAAVDLANAANAGETVWVSNGTYRLSSQVFVTNAIVRGYTGNPADAIVNGNGSVRGFYLNHANARVQDLTISNGLANATPNRYYGGGACVAMGTLTHCILANNKAAPSAQSGYGGGAYCVQAGALVSRCVFATNSTGPTSGSGGGLYMDGGLAVSCLFTNNVSAYRGAGAGLNAGGVISNSTFVGNRAIPSGAGGGGGVYMAAGTVANCSLFRNVSLRDGGGAMMVGPSAVLMNSTSIWNTSGTGSAGLGGGVAMRNGTVAKCVINNNIIRGTGGGGVYMAVTSTVVNTTITGNTATNIGGTSTAEGAGIYCDTLRGLVTNCVISSNLAITVFSAAGGGVYYNSTGRGAVFKDCVISANRLVCPVAAGWGCGVWAYSGSRGLLLDHCVISDNRGSGAAGASGGGFMFYESAATARFCRVTGNRCGINSYNYGGGAALYKAGAVTGCIITNNTILGIGGGLYMSGTSTVANTTICGNVATNPGGTATAQGGGLYCATLSGLISNCVISSNTAITTFSAAGGGFFYGTAARGAVVRDCVISGNRIVCPVAAGMGGGIAANNGSSGLLLDRCTISDNSGTGAAGSSGGGIMFYQTASKAQFCRITRNRCGSSNYNYGGGVALNAGSRLVNCLIANNEAMLNAVGGGVAFVGSGSALINCTVVSNRASGASGNGGGVSSGTRQYTGAGALVNCIVYTNRSSTAANYNWSLYDAGSTLYVTSNPRFVDAAGGDYRLVRGSPCINAGLTEPWMYGSKDLDGRARVEENVIDMGAYESKPGGTFALIR